MKHLVKTSGAIGAAFAVFVGFLAVASYLSGGEVWDGGFPSGEFRINIRDTVGTPIRGAVLRVYRGGTRELASGYPLDNHRTGQELASNDNGRITAFQTRDGTQFGGYTWRLFWCIPMGARAPEYDCEITAESFQPAKFPIWRIFDAPLAQRVPLPDQDGNQTEMRIYEQSIILER